MVISEIVTGSKNSEDQKSTLKDIKTLYKSRGKFIELFDDYSGIVSESILELHLNLNTKQNMEKD